MNPFSPAVDMAHGGREPRAKRWSARRTGVAVPVGVIAQVLDHSSCRVTPGRRSSSCIRMRSAMGGAGTSRRRGGWPAGPRARRHLALRAGVQPKPAWRLGRGTRTPSPARSTRDRANLALGEPAWRSLGSLRTSLIGSFFDASSGSSLCGEPLCASLPISVHEHRNRCHHDRNGCSHHRNRCSPSTEMGVHVRPNRCSPCSEYAPYSRLRSTGA